MKILDGKISKYWLIGIAITVLLASTAVVAAVSSIWSNSTKAVVNPWNGQITLALNSTNAQGTFNSGDTIQFTATLSPVPLQPQTLTVYYTTIANPTSSTPLATGGDPATGLIASTTTITTNGAGVAVGTWKPTVAGTYYFIAEDITPT